MSGRRALPKSFLDRFFRVHVAALALVDFEAVASKKYALDEELARDCAACVSLRTNLRMLAIWCAWRRQWRFQ